MGSIDTCSWGIIFGILTYFIPIPLGKILSAIIALVLGIKSLRRSFLCGVIAILLGGAYLGALAYFFYMYNKVFLGKDFLAPLFSVLAPKNETTVGSFRFSITNIDCNSPYVVKERSFYNTWKYLAYYPRNGYKICKIYYTVTNIGSEKALPSIWSFKLCTDRGHCYSNFHGYMASNAKEIGQKGEQLLCLDFYQTCSVLEPDKSCSACVAFEIPKDESPTELKVNLGALNGGYGTIYIDW